MIISAEETRGVPSAELIEKTRLVAVHHTVVRHDVAAESGDETRGGERETETETETERARARDRERQRERQRERGEGDHQSR
jgi:hypothetical protein